eukprot:GHVS01035544.1.p1 GENE.GHVS01035544.1~~GHVS01035544.1.p1  ORF type:complete len:113 (+),score=9.77 GHVS01035544.1:626-964(+)
MWVLPCHSSLPLETQRKVFNKPANRMQKFIVATNIAETFITIDVYVIDTGTHKEKRFVPEPRISSLVEDVISQASGQQRAGRAGIFWPLSNLCPQTLSVRRHSSCARLFPTG